MHRQLIILPLALICLSASAIHAQQPEIPLPPPPQPASITALEGLAKTILKQVIPDQYTDDSKWGRTKNQTVGLRFDGNPLKFDIQRRKKQLNDGLWKLYRLDLADSDQWEIAISDPRDLGDGRVAFDATFATPLKVHARASQWEHGVQLFSISAQADARVRLTLNCEMRLQLIAKGLLPGIRLEPKVTEADLLIEDFRLRRISNLHGPLVHELGKEAHDILQREVNKRREKLTAKINTQIEKQQDHLTLSLADLADSKWNVFAKFATP